MIEEMSDEKAAGRIRRQLVRAAGLEPARLWQRNLKVM